MMMVTRTAVVELQKKFENLRNLIITEQVLNMCRKELHSLEERAAQDDGIDDHSEGILVGGTWKALWESEKGQGKDKSQTSSSSKSQMQGDRKR